MAYLGFHLLAFQKVINLQKENCLHFLSIQKYIKYICLFVKKKKKTLEGYKRNWSSQLPPGSGTGLKKDKDGKETFHSIYSFGHFEL